MNSVASNVTVYRREADSVSGVFNVNKYATCFHLVSLCMHTYKHSSVRMEEDRSSLPLGNDGLIIHE